MIEIAFKEPFFLEFIANALPNNLHANSGIAAK
jgi:hypothetical protein